MEWLSRDNLKVLHRGAGVEVARGTDGLGGVALLVIFAVALCVRAAAFSRFHQATLILDIQDYEALGWNIASTGEFGTRYRAVGFPAFLALVYAVLGHSPKGAMIVSGLLGAASAAVLARAVATSAGARQGWWAGLLLAVYPGVAVHNVALSSEGFAATLFTFVMGAAIVLLRRPSVLLAVAGGLTAGWLGLVRTPLLLVGPFLALGLYQYGRRRAATVLVLASLIPPLIWAAQTKHAYGHWMVGDWNVGHNLYMGNNPKANGRFGIPHEVYAPRFTDEFQRDQFYRQAALNWIRSEPIKAASLVPARLRYLMNSEHKDLILVYSNGWLGERSRGEISALLGSYILGWLILIPFALWGLIGCWRAGEVRLASLAVAAGLILYLMSYADSRYHVPVVPGVVVLASWGITTRFRPKDLGAARVTLLGVLLSLFLVNAARDLVESWPVFQRVTSPGGSSIHYGQHELQ
jgi:hypothetical protein